RGDVIRYVTQNYGDDRVAQIITYGTIKAKAAVKDATRVLGFPYALGDRITKAFPPAVMGKDTPLSGVFDPKHPRYGEAGEIRALYEAEAEVRQVLDTARGLETLPLDDKPTYELLARGDTLGVFQLDGGPMRALLRSMHADRFEDIVAVNALYRPGPMGANAHNEYADRKAGRKPVVPIHPALAE